ncbi:MAG: ABC transporter permease [Lachnospiraceae bacterium]|nr:ABC transporter permease [Candidatus Merdinaster equi]
MTSANQKKEKYVGRFNQVKVYFLKFVRIFFAEKQWFMIVMAAVIAWIVAFVVGRAFFVTMEGTLLGALALVCVCLWNGVFNSIQVVCKERQIIKREHRSGLSITSYVASHMLIQMILCAIQSIVTILVLAICGVHFPEAGVVTPVFVIDLFVTVFLTTYGADMLGLMVSCIVRNTTLAMTVMPFLLIVQLVFAGVAFPLAGFADKVSELTVTKHGVTAICSIGDYNSLSSMSILNPLRKIESRSQIVKEAVEMVSEETIARETAKMMQDENYNPTVENVLIQWATLIISSAVYVLIGWVALKFVDKDRR